MAGPACVRRPIMAAAIGVMVLAVSACSGSVGGSGSLGGSASITPQVFPSPGPVTATVGQPVLVDDIELTLLDVRCSSSAPPRLGYIWVGFEVAARNPDPVPWVRVASSFSAASDRKWAGESDITSGAPAAWQPRSKPSSVEPGETKTGWVVFGLPRPQNDIAFGYAPNTWSFWAVEWDVTCPNVSDAAGTPPPAAQAPAANPAIDQARVAQLTEKIEADPNDTATLIELGDLYSSGSDYATAGTFYDKALAVDPANVQALLGRGAAAHNVGDLATAGRDWRAAAAADPQNAEAHNYHGFMYFEQSPPDVAQAKAEWSKVVELAPGSSLSQTAQQHLQSLESPAP